MERLFHFWHAEFERIPDLPMDERARPLDDFDALSAAILKERDNLPKRLRQVAAHALANPDDIAFGTVASIAASADVQPSALVRFAQAFGFSGFSDLQSVFRQRLRARSGAYEDRLKAIRSLAAGASSDGALIDGFLSSARASLERLAQGFDLAAFGAAADRIAAAETVYLIGRRRSYPVTSFLAYAFGKLGLRFFITGSPSGIDEEMLSVAGPRDAAIGVTFPPYAPQTVAEIRQLSVNQVGIVAITDGPFSPLWPLANEKLAVAEADFQGFRSLSAAMALAMALAVAVGERRQGGWNETK